MAMKKSSLIPKITITTIALMAIVSCGPSEADKQKAINEAAKHKADSLKEDDLKFTNYYNELLNRFKTSLTKNGDFFIDYTTGTIEVPQGCLWKLGKY